MKALRLPLFLLCAASLTACDSVTGPLVEGDAQVDRPAGLADVLQSSGESRIAVCHPELGASYTRLSVTRQELEAHLQHGDKVAGGAVLDRNCEPVEAVAACPCYSASELGGGIAGAVPEPYLFFDVYRYYNEDPRRTEVRSTLDTEHGLLEEVAAVYVTPAGSSSDPLVPICYTQDATLDPLTDEPIYVYDTVGLTIAEAEACRAEVYAFAESEGQECQGGACGLPYTEEHLDPDFPPYHDDGFRTPTPVLDALRARIEAVRERLALPA